MQKFVEQGEVDVGVVLLPVDENMFFTTPLARETLQLVVHKSHPLAQHSTISLKELKDETLISFHEDFTMHEMVYNECLKMDLRLILLLKALSGTSLESW